MPFLAPSQVGEVSRTKVCNQHPASSLHRSPERSCLAMCHVCACAPRPPVVRSGQAPRARAIPRAGLCTFALTEPAQIRWQPYLVRLLPSLSGALGGSDQSMMGSPGSSRSESVGAIGTEKRAPRHPCVLSFTFSF